MADWRWQEDGLQAFESNDDDDLFDSVWDDAPRAVTIAAEPFQVRVFARKPNDLSGTDRYGVLVEALGHQSDHGRPILAEEYVFCRDFRDLLCVLTLLRKAFGSKVMLPFPQDDESDQGSV